jgi:hypothetical protein
MMMYKCQILIFLNNYFTYVRGVKFLWNDSTYGELFDFES